MFKNRRFIALVSAAAAAALVFALAPAIAQSEDDEPAEAATTVEGQPAPSTELTRADTFTSGVWEVAVGDMFSAASNRRLGFVEVRVAIVMRNNGDGGAIYRSDGFLTDPSYPRLGIVDSSGTERSLRGARGLQALMPTSTVAAVPPGMTGSWTAGFDVPADFADSLQLVVRGTDGAASFDLAAGTPPELAGTPALATEVGLGDAVGWGAMTAAATGFGNLVCGDPNRELASHIVAVSFEVENENNVPLVWPGVNYPEVVAMVQWADGSTARTFGDTFVGDVDLGQVVLPGAAAERALLFMTPRDSRVGATFDSPIGMWLIGPGSGLFWVPLEGPGDLAMDNALCDEGNFSFPIPNTFAPGPEFAIGSFVPGMDAEAADDAARQLLVTGVLAAGRYRVASDDSYENVSAAALRAIESAVTFSSSLSAEVGIVGVRQSVEELDSGDVYRAVLMVQSESGNYLCATLLDDAAGFATAETFEEAETTCDPASAGAEAAAEEEAAEEES